MNAKRLVLALALLLPAATAGAATTSVIVELPGEPAAVWKARARAAGQVVSDAQLDAYRAQLHEAQDAVLARAAAAGIAATVDRATVYGLDGRPAASFEQRFTLLYNGVTVEVPVEQTAALAAVEGVKKVHRVRLLEAQLDRSVPYVRAPQLYGRIPELGPWDDVREGYEGQGVNVAVIDTGIEWQHEMFGADATPPRLGILPPNVLANNRKVVYYIPFGDLAVEDGVGHGTHVASTAAGYRGFTYGADGVPLNGDDVPIHGVAPQARIMAYAVCANVISNIGALTGAIGGCLNSNTILALEDAVSPRSLTGYPKPVAHVINLSLGGSYGTPDDPTAVASSNAALLGAVVVAAAGNSGDVAGIVGSPSTGRRVISVAASTDPGVAASLALGIDPLDAAGNRLAGAPAIAATRAPESNLAQPYDGGITGRYVYAGFADTPDQVPATVAGNICLVSRGGTVEVGAPVNQGSGYYANKAAQCYAKGATAVVAFNNVPGEIGSVLSPSPLLVVTISREAGLYLRDTLGFDAGGVSNHRIRINGPSPGAFTPAQAGFSSRGPVSGYGQVKPDLSAPGVAIVAAIPPASLMGALGATAHGPWFADAQGTSMATPHVAGAAALVKQANPTWHPDLVRAALMNTATPFRGADGQPIPYGPTNEKINAQGAGLVDVTAAARAKALMGVAGDGVVAPFLLASHSFGAVPLLGNECTSALGVTVTLMDLRGTGGTYRLRGYANRNTDGAAVSFVLPDTVAVPANGTASFTAGIAVDGGALGGGSLAELQWFVVAERTDGTERLAMPMYLRAIPSTPGAAIGGLRDEVSTFAGTVPGGTPAVVFQANHTVAVPLGTLRIAALLEGDELVDGALTELELVLLDGAGTVVATSSVDGNREYLEYDSPAPGTYTVRPRSQTGGPVSYDLTVTLTRVDTPAAAVLAPAATEHTDLGGGQVDFDGAFGLGWAGSGRETGFAVEQRVGAGPWQRVALLPGEARSHDLSGLGDGVYDYRVLAHYPGALCTYVAAPSNERRVTVDRRIATDATASTSLRITRSSFDGSVFEVDFVLVNNGTTALLNPVEMAIVGIHSADGDVTVINADNGGGGTGPADAARFSYAAQVGDESLQPGETSAVRTVRFADPSGSMFTIDRVVTAYVKSN